MALMMLGRQTDMRRAVLLVPEPSFLVFEVANENLKRYKSSGIGQIPTELFQARRNTSCSNVHRLTNFIRGKYELPHQWKESIIVSM
jgi:hypothetical protein